MLKAGIIGLPNVGKSTLFNALVENAKAQAANFPFCTIEPNKGIVSVPDQRLQDLGKLSSSQNIIPTKIEFVDIAGLVKGASKGEGLGNKFLANIRETNAIIHVLRCFEDNNIVHVDGTVNPVRDKETIDIELQLKDLESLEKLRDKNLRTAKSGNKSAQKILETTNKYIVHLSAGNSARTLEASEEDLDIVSELDLLTMKPVLYVCNVDEASVKNGNKYVDDVKRVIRDEEIIVIATAIEAEISELENLEEQMMFLEELGLKKPGVHYLIQATYKLLRLQTYFTAGKKEVRAWTITKGIKAPQAAAVIHTDFEKGFIRAETISYDDFISNDGWVNSKNNGKMRLEGKDYIVKDGDVLNFRFNT